MSNLTPDDVDLRLTASKAELSEEDQRLWLGLEDEKISRIAGDEANKQFTELVKQQNSGTESRLSTEVIHRSEGDVSNLNSLNAVAQALSDYRIKTDLEINNEVIARKALGVELNTRIDSFVSTWDHQKYLIYQAIQDVQDDIDGKYSSMDTRIVKYEQMLSDITADSIQITTDNGEINMGAWTILSQAREWDLQIIGRMKDFQVNTQQDLNQALEDIQNKLPVEQNIIDKAIQGLSNSQVIKDLDEKLTSNIADISAINQDLLDEVTARQNEMIAQAQNTANALQAQADELSASVSAEANERIEALLREATIRSLQIEDINTTIADETADRLEEIRLLEDGLTAETESRIEGDLNITTSLNNYKESNDTALANVMQRVEVAITGTTANAEMANSLDARLTVAEGAVSEAKSLAATANSTATVAVDATTVLAERMDSVEGSITTVTGVLESKADVIAFNSLKTDVSVIDGKVASNTASIASITGSIVTLDNALTLNANALNEMRVVQGQQGEQYNQLASSVTALSADVAVVKGDLNTKADTTVTNGLSTQINNLEGTVSIVSSDVTLLKGSLETLEGEVSNKADASALSELNSKVIEVDNRVIVTNNSLLSLEGRVATTENGIASKLDASVINNYYTKTESDNAIAGQITTFKSVFAQGGDNLLVNSNVDKPYIGTYPHGTYALGESWEVGATYTLLWCASFVRKSPDQNNLVLAAYAGGGLQDLQSISSEGERQVHKVTFVVRPEGTGYNTINFYLLNSNGGYLDAVATVHWAVLVKASDVLTDAWVQSKYDINNAISANAQAIRNTETAVATIDGKVTAQATELLNLNSSLTNLNNTKLDASAISNYYTKTQVDDKATTIAAGEVSKYTANLKVGGRNLWNPGETISAFESSGGYTHSNDAHRFLPTYLEVSGSKLLLQIWNPNKVINRDYSNRVAFYTEDKTHISSSGLNLLSGETYQKQEFNIPANAKYMRLSVISGVSTYDPSIKFKFELGTVYTEWTASEEEVANAINSNSTAIQNTNAEVSRVDGRVTATSSAQTLLEGRLQTVEGDITKKADASVLSSLDIRVGTVEGGIASQANQLTSLSAKLNERKVYQLYSGGLNSATGGMGWLRGFDPSSYYDIGRSYGLVVFNGDGSIQSVNSYDVYGGNTQGFIDAVASVPTGTYVAVLTSDEPRNNSVHIKGALKSLGGSDAIDQVVGRGAYLLVGRKDLPTGQAIEKVSNTTSFGVDYLLEMYNGVPIGLGGSSPQSGIISNMRTEVSNIGGNITSLSETVTQHTASLTNLSLGGFNLLYNGDFSTNSYSGWNFTAHITPAENIAVLNRNGGWLSDWALDADPSRTLAINTQGAYPVDGQQYIDAYQKIAVSGDSFYQLSAYVAPHRSKAVIYATFFNHLSEIIGYSTIGVEPNSVCSMPDDGSIGGKLLQNYRRIHVNTKTPPDTAYMHFNIRFVSFAGAYLFMTRTMCCQVSALNAPLMPWNEGSSAAANVASTSLSKVTEVDGRLSSLSQQTTVLSTTVDQNTSKLVVQGNSIDGIKAEYFIKTDVNGLVAGYGLVNSGTTSAFGVNADYFYVGNGTTATGGKKPFMVLTSAQTIGGVTYPAGTWIDVALIANATIGSAHIANASITDAHIVSLNASKITAGIIDAERIGANSISVEKLMVGDATNLWGNQHFTQFNPYPKSPNNRERWVTDVTELKGNGIQMWGRDHYAPYTSKIPLKEGDTFVIEYIAGRTGGPDVPLHVGLWTYNINGNGGSAPWQSGPAEQIANLGGGWFRWRRVFVVTNNGHTLPVAYGVLYFLIGQEANEPDPAYWSVGDVTVRKGVGGELIVNGSVTADKMQVDSLSAISADLGTIKVDTAHIEDAAVTNAKIADLAVDTLKIQGNSVTVPTVAYTVAAIQVSSAWTTIQSITAQSSLGLTLFNFNWFYASTRSDTRYIVNYRILKNGVEVVAPARIFLFEVNLGSNSATASPSGTLSLSYSDSSLVDGTYELQLQLTAGSKMNFLNRYASALVVRR